MQPVANVWCTLSQPGADGRRHVTCAVSDDVSGVQHGLLAVLLGVLNVDAPMARAATMLENFGSVWKTSKLDCTGAVPD